MANFGKDWRPTLPEPAGAPLNGRVHDLRSALRFQVPDLVAGRSGASYLRSDQGSGAAGFHIQFWEDVRILSFPELTGSSDQNQPFSDFHVALLLYYLHTADGTPLTGKWVSLADLPDGRIYNAAFQGYSGDEVVKAFGLDLDGFQCACLAAGGKPVDLGNASFVFQALPRVPLMLTYWLGDEDFPSACKVLFDESASHYLPIEACAILGRMLIRRLIHS